MAEECFDKALEMDSQSLNAFLAKGLALAEFNCFEEAIASYDAVLQVNPQYDNAWYGRSFPSYSSNVFGKRYYVMTVCGGTSQ